MESVTIKRLRTKAIFKVILTGLTCSFVPTFTLVGILASLDLMTMYWGETQLTGFRAALFGPFFGLFFAIFFGLFASVFVSLGLMIYSKRKPLTLEIYEYEKSEIN